MAGYLNELPAEELPLTPSTLYETLTSATSADPKRVEDSTKQLQKWETKAGYYGLLQVPLAESS